VQNHSINWFEIPTRDLERAARFYESVLEASLRREDFGGVPHAIFLASAQGIGGALVHDPHNQPSSAGSRVYLNVTGKLDECLARVSAAGGEVLLPKTDISPNGFMAIVKDSEGNHVGFHSR